MIQRALDAVNWALGFSLCRHGSTAVEVSDVRLGLRSSPFVYDQNQQLIYAPLFFLLLMAVIIIYLLVNVTRLRSLGRRLEESEETARVLLNATTDVALLLDPDGTVVTSNEAALEAVEEAEGDMADRKVYELALGFEGREDQVKQVLRSGRAVRFEARDAGRWLDNSVYPIFNQEGVVIRLAAFSRDITERKEAEQEREELMARIQKQAQRVEQIVETVPEGVLLLNSAGEISMANPAAERALKVLVSDPSTGRIERLGDLALEEIIATPGQKRWHEIQIEEPGPRYFQTIAQPIRAGSTVEGWVLVIRDVTQEREARRRAQQQERLAAVGQLAAGIAHDFNNILTTIMLYAQMLMTRPAPSGEFVSGLKTIIAETQGATELVRQILDFSRRSLMEKVSTDLVSLVGEIGDILTHTMPESIRIQISLDVEECLVMIDPKRIQQAVMNLAVNARDAMPQGGLLRVTVSRLTLEAGEEPPLEEMTTGEWACLMVSDTGSGVDEEIREHLFEPFYTTKSSGQGTGLGLAQVYGIVKQHNGFIDVETSIGQGTTFRIYLPVHDRPADARPEADEKEETTPRGQGETILLVEDEERIRRLLQGLLSSLGYRVLTAKNGHEAIAVYESCGDDEEIHLLITDMVMPVMGGKVLIRELRRRAPKLRSLVITGYAVTEDLDDAEQYDILGVIQKPFDANELGRMVRRALDAP